MHIARQPREEIRSKALLFDQLLQRLMRRGYDANIHFDRLSTPNG